MALVLAPLSAEISFVVATTLGRGRWRLGGACFDEGFLFVDHHISGTRWQ